MPLDVPEKHPTCVLDRVINGHMTGLGTVDDGYTELGDRISVEIAVKFSLIDSRLDDRLDMIVQEAIKHDEVVAVSRVIRCLRFDLKERGPESLMGFIIARGELMLDNGRKLRRRSRVF